jgi:hypothetical protein
VYFDHLDFHAQRGCEEILTESVDPSRDLVRMVQPVHAAAVRDADEEQPAARVRERAQRACSALVARQSAFELDAWSLAFAHAAQEVVRGEVHVRRAYARACVREKTAAIARRSRLASAVPIDHNVDDECTH